jgi:hypothetical protein
LLTKLTICNFKRFGKVEIELGNPVVFIGPNDSGKTTALQALALWDIGVKRWNERRKGKATPEKRPGVTINRRDLIAVPIPDASLLWRDLHVRDVSKTNGKQETKNIRVDITVEGVTEGNAWRCGVEFDYANEESFYCRPLRLSEEKNPERMPVPEEAGKVRVAFLPPMSGLAASETRLDPGAVNVRLGEGRTAEVLRNLCYQILTGPDGVENWRRVCGQIEALFGVRLDNPKYVPERGEIVMTYRQPEPSGVRLDLSSSGRGLQQTLLLLAHLVVNPESVLLLDEPDAHLEILRQRDIYQLLTEEAREYGSQIIAASHSEVILNEAADRDVVVAFLGPPHRIDDRGSQVLKSLKEIGFQEYYQAEQTGWVLYVEGSTDLAILRAFAKTLGHPAAAVLERPFMATSRGRHVTISTACWRPKTTSWDSLSLTVSISSFRQARDCENKCGRGARWRTTCASRKPLWPTPRPPVLKRDSARCSTRRRPRGGARRCRKASKTSYREPPCVTPPIPGGQTRKPAMSSWTASFPASSASWACRT